MHLWWFVLLCKYPPCFFLNAVEALEGVRPLTLDTTLFFISGQETQSVKSEPMLKVDDFLQGQGITNEQTMVGTVPGNLNKENLHRQL